MEEGIRIGVLASSKGNKLQAIVDACSSGLIKGKVVFVCSDNPDAYALERARKLGIPSFVVDYAALRNRCRIEPESLQLPVDCDFEEIMRKQRLFASADQTHENLRFRLATRVIAETMILDHIAPYQFDLLVLAGFIRKLTPYFIEKVNAGTAIPKIMNLHATLSPAFPGVDGYGQTLRHGCKVAGCTVHFVDYGVDSGPIIEQEAFKIEPDDNAATVKKKGLQLECDLYPKCIRLFAEKRLVLKKNVTGRTIVSITPDRTRNKLPFEKR